MISKIILYKHEKKDEHPYKVMFYFHPLRKEIKLPIKLGKFLFYKKWKVWHNEW